MGKIETGFETLLDKLSPRVAEIFLREVQKAKDTTDMERLISAIERADVAEIVTAIIGSEEWFDEADFYAEGSPAGVAILEALREVYSEAGDAVFEGVIAELEKFVPRGGRALGRFRPGYMDAAEWATEKGALKVVGIDRETREAIRSRLWQGLSDGMGPRAIALDLVGRISSRTGKREGGVVGLTRQQQRYARDAYYELSDGLRVGRDGRTGYERYLSRKLRDKRWDRMVKRLLREGKEMPMASRQAALAAYENRMLRHRGETIARTETLFAIHSAQDDALKKMVDSGLLKRNWITRRWRTARDNRVRESHDAMEGRAEDDRGLFVMPSGAMMAYPGDPNGPAEEVINCRCWVQVEIDFLQELLEAEGLESPSPGDQPYRVDPRFERPPPLGTVSSFTPYGNTYNLDVSAISERPESEQLEIMRGLGVVLDKDITDFRIRSDYGDTLSIIGDGRFMNQHEVGDSNGAYNPGLREWLEESLWDLDTWGEPPGSPDRYAIYGYITGRYDPDSPPVFNGSASHYGRVIWRLNQEALRERSTFTMGDTLNWAGRTGAVGYREGSMLELFPSPVNDPQHYSVPMNPLAAEIAELGKGGAGTVADADHIHAKAPGSEYTELQVFGGINIDTDVDELWLPQVDDYFDADQVFALLREGYEYERYFPIRLTFSSYRDLVLPLYDASLDRYTGAEQDARYAKLWLDLIQEEAAKIVAEAQAVGLEISTEAAGSNRLKRELEYLDELANEIDAFYQSAMDTMEREAVLQ